MDALNNGFHQAFFGAAIAAAAAAAVALVSVKMTNASSEKEVPIR